MSKNINPIANSLIGMGIKPGQRVALMGRNSIEYSQMYCGIVTAGACAVVLSIMINGPTLKLMLKDSQARVLFMAEEFKDLLIPLENERGLLMGGQDQP